MHNFGGLDLGEVAIVEPAGIWRVDYSLKRALAELSHSSTPCRCTNLAEVDSRDH